MKKKTTATKKIKRWTLGELKRKQENKLYFDPKTQKFFGVRRASLVIGKKAIQYYLEHQQREFIDGSKIDTYMARPIPKSGIMHEANGKSSYFYKKSDLEKFIGKPVKI